jgi:hypothetical protein
VGFVVDKVALGQVFSEYFDFPCQSSFQQLLHSHPHLSSEAGTIGQKWPQYKGLSPAPLAIKKIFPEQNVFHCLQPFQIVLPILLFVTNFEYSKCDATLPKRSAIILARL